MACRGIRGATTVALNTKEAILEGTKELLRELVKANDLKTEDVAYALFTTTRDLNAEFPAVAARQMGWGEVALMCSHEMDVPDAMAGVIRILLLVNTEKPQSGVVHVYLKETRLLRQRGVSADGAKK